MDGNKTGLITYRVTREVLLKSRMRENLKSYSVRGTYEIYSAIEKNIS